MQRWLDTALASVDDARLDELAGKALKRAPSASAFDADPIRWVVEVVRPPPRRRSERRTGVTGARIHVGRDINVGSAWEPIDPDREAAARRRAEAAAERAERARAAVREAVLASIIVLVVMYASWWLVLDEPPPAAVNALAPVALEVLHQVYGSLEPGKVSARTERPPSP